MWQSIQGVHLFGLGGFKFDKYKVFEKTNNFLISIEEKEAQPQLNPLLDKIKNVKQEEGWTPAVQKLKKLVELAQSSEDRELVNSLLQLILLIFKAV